MKRDKKTTVAICLKASTIEKLKAEALKQDLSLSALIQKKLEK